MFLVNHSQPGAILAPMEGVTDAPMRALLTEQSPYLFCMTEFLRVTEQVPPVHVFRRHIPELLNEGRTPNGTPVVIQLLGGNPTKLTEAALRAVSLGAKGIDLNFGCPAPTVNRHDGGATLLQYPKRIFDIISAVRNAVPKDISVSVKLRLGWDDPNDIFHNLEWVLKASPSWIILHARTRMQGYSKPVFWEHIGKVVSLADIPVVANGDIWSFQDFRKCLEITGCRHFMLGRGAVGNPYLVNAIDSYLKKAALPDLFEQLETPGSWKPLVSRFVELSLPFTPQTQYIVRRIKQWIKMASLEKPLPWFENLKRTQTLKECLNIFGIEIDELRLLSHPDKLFEVSQSTARELDSPYHPIDRRGRFPSHYLQ